MRLAGIPKPSRAPIKASRASCSTTAVALLGTATLQHRSVFLYTRTQTLADYRNDRWLPLKKSQLSRSTFDSYRNNVRLHVALRIGTIQLRQLQPEDLDTFYAELLVEGKRNGADGGLAPKAAGTSTA
jgi:hypothetical protein